MVRLIGGYKPMVLFGPGEPTDQRTILAYQSQTV
jgi:hypothetical protein